LHAAKQTAFRIMLTNNINRIASSLSRQAIETTEYNRINNYERDTRFRRDTHFASEEERVSFSLVIAALDRFVVFGARHLIEHFWSF